MAVVPRVVHRHAPAALGAMGQASEQRRALPHHAQSVGPGAIRLQPSHVFRVFAPRDIGGQPIREQDQPVVGGRDGPAGARPPAPLPARVDGAAPVDVGAGVDRMLEQVLQGCAVGTPPHHRAARQAAVLPHPQRDLVGDEIAQQRVDGPQLRELAEDQPNHLLDLLVGVEDERAGVAPHVPHGWDQRQLAPARLGQQPLSQPLLHDV